LLQKILSLFILSYCTSHAKNLKKGFFFLNQLNDPINNDSRYSYIGGGPRSWAGTMARAEESIKQQFERKYDNLNSKLQKLTLMLQNPENRENVNRRAKKIRFSIYAKKQMG
jgi:hypothetical protein